MGAWDTCWRCMTSTQVKSFPLIIWPTMTRHSSRSLQSEVVWTPCTSKASPFSPLYLPFVPRFFWSGMIKHQSGWLPSFSLPPLCRHHTLAYACMSIVFTGASSPVLGPALVLQVISNSLYYFNFICISHLIYVAVWLRYLCTWWIKKVVNSCGNYPISISDFTRCCSQSCGVEILATASKTTVFTLTEWHEK